AMIVAPRADLELATRAILFSAAGTCGQRCTSLRRLIVHASIHDELLARVERAYGQIRIGDPRDPSTLVGPLIDASAFDAMQAALTRARADGGQVTGGGRVVVAKCQDGFYVTPAVVRMPAQTRVVQDETFAPILYAMSYHDLD